MEKKDGIDRKGFTLVEVVVVIAVVALLAGILVPLISKNIDDSKRARAKNEAVVIAASIGSLYKDVGLWPTTDKNGPTWGPGLDRLATNLKKIPRGRGQGAARGAENWGKYGKVKSLGDFLFYNNPDNDQGSKGQNQSNQDYPTTGEFKWNGPYLDSPEMVDPWNRSYIINARYFGGNPRYKGSVKHKIYVLSAGPNGLWETSYDDRTGDGNDTILGDDIGVVVSVR